MAFIWYLYVMHYIKGFPFATHKSLRKLVFSLSCFTDKDAEIEGQISLLKVTQVSSGRTGTQPQIILIRAHIFNHSTLPFQFPEFQKYLR